MKIGFYAGSFDPFTNGHLHVVKAASKLFDKVIVAIGENSLKQRRFDNNKMREAVEKVIKSNNLSNVEVITYNCFTADLAQKYGTTFLIRGLRNGMDYQYEENISAINEKTSGLDTIYIRAGRHGSTSSSMVMELLQYGKDVSEYVPKEILELLKQEYK